MPGQIQISVYIRLPAHVPAWVWVACQWQKQPLRRHISSQGGCRMKLCCVFGPCKALQWAIDTSWGPKLGVVRWQQRPQIGGALKHSAAQNVSL
jgi:hypothetical protein